MNGINLTAVEIYPSKKYIIIPSERIHAEAWRWLDDQLKEMGVHGLLVNMPFDIVPLDQVEKIEGNP